MVTVAQHGISGIDVEYNIDTIADAQNSEDNLDDGACGPLHNMDG